MKKDLHYAILKVLSYFHFFKYPITQAEIFNYLPAAHSSHNIDVALAELKQAGIIYQLGSFYSLTDDTRLADRRIEGNRYAEKRLVLARRIARFLANFPFVESICISGSLSKDFSAPDGDLDFFIITSPNRLWIARSLMHAFKKFTFLFGAQHSFCMNYFLGAEQLSVNPKNFFTAIEIVTLKPVFVRKGVNEMYHANKDWIKLYLPNNECKNIRQTYMHEKWLPSRLFEKVADLVGDRLNGALYTFTRYKWIHKWRRKGYDVDKCLECISISVNTPVNYPVNFVEQIVNGYEQVYRMTIKSAEQKLKNITQDIEDNIVNKQAS
jgi:hypothetical protein